MDHFVVELLVELLPLEDHIRRRIVERTAAKQEPSTSLVMEEAASRLAVAGKKNFSAIKIT